MTIVSDSTETKLNNGPSYSEDPLQFLPRALTSLYSRWVRLSYPFASLGKGLSVHPYCDWQRSQAHRISLGNHVQIRKDALLRVAASSVQSDEPAIIVDDETCLGPACQLIAKNRVHIERDVLIGQSVLITDHGYSVEEVAGVQSQRISEGGRVRIGQGSWIGYRAAIVCNKGELVLGRNCVVAANSLVTRSFPPYSVIFGNPARVIRQYDPAKKRWVLKTA